MVFRTLCAFPATILTLEVALKGADVTLLNALGENALQMALAHGQCLAVLKLLCAGEGTVLHARPSDSFTALHLAALASALSGSLDPLRLLVPLVGEVMAFESKL
jgi:hypothetical protein